MSKYVWNGVNNCGKGSLTHKVRNIDPLLKGKEVINSKCLKPGDFIEFSDEDFKNLRDNVKSGLSLAETDIEKKKEKRYK